MCTLHCPDKFHRKKQSIGAKKATRKNNLWARKQPLPEIVSISNEHPEQKQSSKRFASNSKLTAATEPTNFILLLQAVFNFY